MKKIIYLLVLTLLITAVFTSGCKNPILGLGPAADIENPTGVIDTYENGDYVRGKIVLNGTSTDDVKIESVRMVLGTEVFDAELLQGEITLWSLALDTSLYDDGEYTIILYITDSSGRETEKRLLLYFDNTPPTVLVTSSEGITSGASTNSPVIRGEAYDYLFSRIDHLEATVVTGSATVSSFQGTNGWSFVLNTIGTGTYSVRIKAYDSAGNSNSWLYHSSDFTSDAKIEDIAAAELSGKLGTQNLAPLRMTEQEVEVDLSLDEPRVVISNPEEGGSAEDNIMGGTSVAVGYIEDDDEVDVDSVELSTDGGSSWQSLSGEQLNGSGGFVRWSYDLSSLDNGIYALQVKAADTGKSAGDASLTGYSSVVPFTIDKTAPSVNVDSPAQGAYLSSGNFTITGTAEDTGGAIQSIEISINNNEYEEVSIVPGESISWSHDVEDAAAGAVDIRVDAIDNSGKTSHYSMQVFVDISAPSVEFLSPAADLFINGTTTLQGVSSDNWSLKQVKLQIGGLAWAPAAAEVLSPSEFYSWQRSIVSSDYENTSMAVEVNGSGLPESGTGIWELKIWAEATDKADNITLAEHRIYIDNSLDRPGINIASPSDGAILAGSVMLSGSAWDDKNELDEALDHIELRIWKGEDSAGGSVFTELFELDALLGLDDVYGDDSWYEISGTGTWQVELNADGEFYPNGIDHNGTVKIDVRAVDQKDGVPDLAGNIETVQVTFDDTVPYFSDLSHASGDYEKGTFNLTGYVNDDDSVKRLRISYNGGVDWTTIGNNLGATYYFSHSIDSDDIIGSSGILYLRLEALDTADYKTLTGINLNIDNLLPSGTYTAGVTDLSGTALVQGTAVDTGTVSGIDRIEVTFELDGTPVNPLNSKGIRTPIVIDSRTEVGNDGSSNGDDDGFNESMAISGSTWTWWAKFDSTSFDDGTLEVLYGIFDNSGNSFTETVTGGNIKNHAPEITSVEAGWDYDHDSYIEAGEIRTYGTDSTENNTVFGDLDYQFNIVYDGANGAETYGIRIRPLPAGSWTDLGSVSSTGTLDTSSTDVFADGDGDYEIEFSVTDPKGYEETLTLTVTVENTDIADPDMDFYELTSADAINVKTSGEGHIEMGGSISISGTAPFSGQAEDNQQIESLAVSINGTAAVVFAQWDEVDDRLEYTADNTPLESGSGFVEDSGVILHRANWIYNWDSSALPTGLGTTVEFIVTDSAGRTDSVTRTYDVVPYISKIETMLSSAFSDTFARSASGKYPVLTESSQSTFETLVVHGWNIDSSAAGSTSVRLSVDPDALNEDGITQTGTLLAHSDAGDNDQQLLVELDAAGSGNLTVIVDGVPSGNNINDNDEVYNKEDSDVHQALSDDRYISVWNITRPWRTITPADHAVYPSMVMDGDDPHFVYVNNSEGFGQAFYLDDTENNYVVTNWDLFTFTAVDLNTDGEHAALVDVNVVNGNFGDSNAGNYGGIFTNFFYDSTAPPYTDLSNSDFTYDFIDNGLWLENLVDTTVPVTSAVLNRYLYPDLAVSGNSASTDVFYSVYDNLEQRLIFRHFLVGTSDAIDDSSGGMLNDTGSSTELYTNVEQQDRGGAWPDYSGDNRFASAGSAQPGATPPGAQYVSSSSGSFSAVGATSDGSTAVLAYLDTTGSGQLVFSYNETPDNSGTWSIPITIESFINAEYIDLKVDSSNHIHLAYYDSYNGDVKYAYIPAYNSAAADVDVYTIDSYLIVGSKLTIDVSSAGVPYIAYKGLGNSARVAWNTGAEGPGVTSDVFTGNWEIQTVPNLIQDTDSNRFNMGVDSAGLPVVGYTADGLEYVRLLDELTD